MATENSILDINGDSVKLGQSTVDLEETVMIRINPANGALLCEVAP